MVRELQRFLDDEAGAEFVEWAVIAIVLLLAVVIIMQAVGQSLKDTFSDIKKWIDAAKDWSPS